MSNEDASSCTMANIVWEESSTTTLLSTCQYSCFTWNIGEPRTILRCFVPAISLLLVCACYCFWEQTNDASWRTTVSSTYQLVLGWLTHSRWWSSSQDCFLSVSISNFKLSNTQVQSHSLRSKTCSTSFCLSVGVLSLRFTNTNMHNGHLGTYNHVSNNPSGIISIT